MTLAQKETHRLMEQNEEPRNRPTHSQSIKSMTKQAKIYNR